MLAKVIFPQQELHFFLQINLSRFLYVIHGDKYFDAGTFSLCHVVFSPE